MALNTNNSSQAWLLSMTGGLASALGAGTLYLDPLLHAIGVPRDVNILESHTVLSAMLAGASGIMAYTSINALTKESTDYLSRFSSWPWCQKYPGAVAAALFVLGAYLNLLLIKVVSLIMPVDSPIKHSCASHVESPDPSPVEISIDSQPSVAKVQGSRGLGISSEPDAGVFPDGEQQPLLMRGTDTDAHSAASRSGATAQEQQEQQRNHRSELILRHHHHCDCHSKSACPDIYIPGYSAECEYACTKASCYQFEHCHITPLYPHAHTHAHPGQHEQGVPHSHGQCYSPVVHDDPESYHSYHHALLDPEDTSGSTSNTDIHQHHVSSSYSHGHRCDHHVHEPEPRVQLSGPGDHTASEVSGHHQQLLLHVGLQTAVAIALHKIPEGLIIFLSRKASPKLGLSVAASLFFHNLPEGLMLALPLFLATGKRTRAFLVSALMGAAPPVVGAAVGSWLLSDAAQDSDADLSGTFGVAFGITAGMMCMVSLNGMLPTARIYDKSGNVVAWSFAFGVASMLFANSTLK